MLPSRRTIAERTAERTLVLGSYIVSLTWSGPKLEREGDSLRWAIQVAKWTARPTLAVVLRYGLAVTSVAAALGTTLILRHHNSPPRFISHFTMIAIAITHRHQPIVGIVVALIFAVA